MSEFEPMNDLPDSVVEGIKAFEQESQKLYGLLDRKTAEDVSVFSYSTQVGELVSTTAEVFAETSTSIVEVYQEQRHAAGFLIASTWFRDANDRLQFFMKRMPSVAKLYEVERPEIEQVVIGILNENNDLEDVYTQLGNSYFQPVASDISDFLTVWHEEREKRIVARTQNMPLTTDESRHFEPVADSLSLFSLKQEYEILKRTLRQS